MQLERWQKFDISIMPNGNIVMVQRDTLPWRGRALFLDKQPDGTFVFSCAIEEQGVPSWCFSATTTLGWMIAHNLIKDIDVQLWSEQTGRKQGAD